MLRKTLSFGLLALLISIAPSLFALGKNDLKGMEIVIGNWWSDYDTRTYQPTSEQDALTLEWRKKIQTEYGFTIREKNIGGWGEYLEINATSIMSGKPLANAILMMPDWAMALKAQNLLYPVSDNKAVDLRKVQPIQRGSLPVEWTQSAIDAFTFNNKIYGFNAGINLSNTTVVFFNKRLFREAGLDPNLPYDMQKAGTWTWDAYFDLCKRLTRDTNNNGRMDTYAMCVDMTSTILDGFLASNGANYVEKDRNGRFTAGFKKPEFLETLQYIFKLRDSGVMKPQPDGSEWNWFFPEFTEGRVAMHVGETYEWDSFKDMRDDWGMVLIPKGPRMRDYVVYTRDNIMIVPSTFKPAEVDRIMFALQLWYTPQTSDWKSGLYGRFRDRRAVDETVDMIRNKTKVVKYYNFIPGFERGQVAWAIKWHDGDPAQLIEGASQYWESLIADVNSKM